MALIEMQKAATCRRLTKLASPAKISFQSRKQVSRFDAVPQRVVAIQHCALRSRAQGRRQRELSTGSLEDFDEVLVIIGAIGDCGDVYNTNVDQPEVFRTVDDVARRWG